MSRADWNPNKRSFFSDANWDAMFEEAGEPAVYADWMPGIGEGAAAANLEGRPIGDNSILPWMTGDRLDSGRQD